ncbi:MAG: SDR family oxidoreductase [Hyphomonadaceae bacterium]|nr:SDR family oxidoreductase [Hyphomonadaceae bacterium]
MDRVKGKIALVTGAAKGLGEATARLLAREGARVVLTDVDVENGVRVAQEIGAAARFVRHDVSDEAAWRAVMMSVEEAEGGLDVLVNNAGVVEIGSIETTKTEDWRRVLAVSADGCFFGCKSAMALLKKSRAASIVNLASVTSLRGYGDFLAYSSAKGAVEALTRSVAVYCSQRQLPIRCNSVHPGSMDTPMVAAMAPKLIAAGVLPPSDTPQMPPTLLGEPDDIANTILFLASDESKFISGQRIVVDYTCTMIPSMLPAPRARG